jgi:dihydropteroate synthase
MVRETMRVFFSARYNDDSMHLSFPNGRQIDLDRPVIVGVLNVTPDSFSDGGLYEEVEAAVSHGLQMVDEGARIIEVGGESTRPGSVSADLNTQLNRVTPVIEQLSKQMDAPICVDTTSSRVAESAWRAGASMLNDVSAGRVDRTIEFAAEHGVPIVLMHMLGEPRTMQDQPEYENVVEDVLAFLLGRAALAERAGLAKDQIVIDPGIGFGKTLEHNLELMRNLHRFVESGYAVMLGASRKSFLGRITGEEDASKRDISTVATTALAVASGVPLIRVHHVKANKESADVAWRISRDAHS